MDYYHGPIVIITVYHQLIMSSRKIMFVVQANELYLFDMSQSMSCIVTCQTNVSLVLKWSDFSGGDSTYLFIQNIYCN